MIIALCIMGYIACIAGFMLWDAFVGLPANFDGHDNPPLWLVALFWPIATPCLMALQFSNFLEASKEKRVEKEKQRKRLRVAAEKEEQRVLRQLERELEGEDDERQSSNRA